MNKKFLIVEAAVFNTTFPSVNEAHEMGVKAHQTYNIYIYIYEEEKRASRS